MRNWPSGLARVCFAGLLLLIAIPRALAQTTYTWTLLSPANAPSARYYHTFAFDTAHGNAVLFGGNDGDRRGDTWIWDGTTWSLVDTPSGPAARMKHSMV